MTNLKERLQVEWVYISQQEQYREVIIWEAVLPHTLRVKDAMSASQYPHLIPDWENRVGIFGEQVFSDTIINNGDRIEIYTPLICDPKETRRQKATAITKALARERSKPKVKNHKKVQGGSFT